MTSPSAVGQQFWLRRVAWLVLIWTASVTILAVVAALFRIMMNVVGLTA